MTKLEKLYDMTIEKDISIIDSHFSESKKAACLYSEDYKLIILDKPSMASSAEETVILAEELGHYETGSLYMIEATYATPAARSTRQKYEAKAKRWAVSHELPAEEIQTAINLGCCNKYEIAEYCSITIDFLECAFEYYKQIGISFSY